MTVVTGTPLIAELIAIRPPTWRSRWLTPRGNMLQELIGLLGNLALYRVTNKCDQQISQRLLMQGLGVFLHLIQNTLIFPRFGVIADLRHLYEGLQIQYSILWIKTRLIKSPVQSL